MTQAYDIWEGMLNQILGRTMRRDEAERWKGLYEAGFGPFDAKAYIEGLEKAGRKR